MTQLLFFPKHPNIIHLSLNLFLSPFYFSQCSINHLLSFFKHNTCAQIESCCCCLLTHTLAEVPLQVEVEAVVTVADMAVRRVLAHTVSTNVLTEFAIVCIHSRIRRQRRQRVRQFTQTDRQAGRQVNRQTDR